MTEIGGSFDFTQDRLQLEVSSGSALRTVLFALLLFGALLIALSFSAEAQQSKKVPRIGYLFANFPTTSPARRGAFRQGLRDLGYVEGKNIVIEYRYAEG